MPCLILFPYSTLFRSDVSESAHRFAVTLASQPPLALASIKATMRNTLLSQFESAIAHERRAQTALYDTDDLQSATGGGYRYAQRLAQTKYVSGNRVERTRAPR